MTSRTELSKRSASSALHPYRGLRSKLSRTVFRSRSALPIRLSQRLYVLGLLGLAILVGIASNCSAENLADPSQTTVQAASDVTSSPILMADMALEPAVIRSPIPENDADSPKRIFLRAKSSHRKENCKCSSIERRERMDLRNIAYQ